MRGQAQSLLLMSHSRCEADDNGIMPGIEQQPDRYVAYADLRLPSTVGLGQGGAWPR